MRAKVDILYSRNLISIMWAIIFNFGFLLTNITGKLFLLDLLLGITPIILNIIYLSVSKECRMSMIPNGWPNVIFITFTAIIGFFFLGCIVYYIGDTIAIKSNNLANGYLTLMFAVVYWCQNLFLIIFYSINIIMLYSFMAYSLEFKKDFLRRKMILKIKEMQDEEAKIQDQQSRALHQIE